MTLTFIAPNLTGEHDMWKSVDEHLPATPMTLKSTTRRRGVGGGLDEDDDEVEAAAARTSRLLEKAKPPAAAWICCCTEGLATLCNSEPGVAGIGAPRCGRER
jgi:hypothetical protein